MNNRCNNKKLIKMKLFIFIVFIYKVNLMCAQKFESPTKIDADNDVEDNWQDLISDEDRRLVMEEDIEKLNKRLDYFVTHDNDKYNKLLKLIGENNNSLFKFNRLILATKCGNDIKKGDFIRASETLNEVYKFNYDEVVHFAYDNNSTNFRNIMNFANNILDKSKTIILYQELFKQSKNIAKRNDFIDMMINIKRYYNLPTWSNLKNDVLKAILHKASEEIRNSVNAFNIKDSNNIMNSVYNLHQQTGLDLMRDVVDKLYSRLQKNNIENLIKYIHGHDNIPIRVAGFTTLFTRIKQDNYLNSQAIFYLGTMYRMTLADRNIDDVTKIKLNKLVDQIPPCIKVAALSHKVCIKNTISGNYLKVSNENKENKWRVLLSIGETSYDRTKWRFEAMENGLYVMLKNIYINRNIKKGESSMMGDRSSNKVVISMPMNSGDYWTIHSAGENCRIKIMSSENYLRDYEGALMLSTYNDSNAIWSVEKC